MNKILDTPQEIEVWVVMPAVRRLLATNLKELGLKQKEIAELLGVTEPAVSQYLSNKRAKDTQFSKDIKDLIKESSKSIHSGKSKPRVEMQRILKEIRKQKYLCRICNSQCDTDKDSGCSICYE